jgi:hypothetical protein
MARGLSEIGEALARVASPQRKCPVPGCREQVWFGDFACSPMHEDVIADQIAAAMRGAACLCGGRGRLADHPCPRCEVTP